MILLLITAALSLFSGNFLDIRDYDLYFKSVAHLNDAFAYLLGIGFNEVVETDNSKTLQKDGVTVQLIKKPIADTHIALFKTFDFTICCFSLSNGIFYFSQDALISLDTKTFDLISINNELPGIFTRMAKYIRKGFNPSEKFVLTLAIHIQTLDLNKIKFPAENSDS